jgi:hypothetical protein
MLGSAAFPGNSAHNPESVSDFGPDDQLQQTKVY